MTSTELGLYARVQGTISAIRENATNRIYTLKCLVETGELDQAYFFLSVSSPPVFEIGDILHVTGEANCHIGDVIDRDMGLELIDPTTRGIAIPNPDHITILKQSDRDE